MNETSTSEAAEPFWTDIERAFVAAVLGETHPLEALERARARVAEHFGGCALVEGHATGPDALAIPLGSPADGNARTLSFPASATLSAFARERLGKLFERLIELAHPVPKGSKALHQLRNRLAGIQTNIEFVEIVLTDADNPIEDRTDLVAAVGHAAAACRDIAAMIRGLAIT